MVSLAKLRATSSEPGTSLFRRTDFSLARQHKIF
jgi:hypothetical protein